jgi:hypothetical protein
LRRLEQRSPACRASHLWALLSVTHYSVHCRA